MTLHKIPLVDLAAQANSIHDDVVDAVSRVLHSAQFILGPEVEEFEDQFAEYCQTRHAVGVANGTEALHMALRALDIGPGDEVITAGNSFAASAFAIAYAGATAVLVDVDPLDFNIDVNLIEEAISPRTKAIIPVHLYGQPARMKEILELARRHNLKVIEDAAQAHGAEVDGQRVGSFGDLACFSFYPGKNLGAYGDGGTVVTNDAILDERLRLLRNYGQATKNVHSMLGYNCRLDTMQAAILLVKMRWIEKWTEQRRQVAAWYREQLADLPLALPFDHSHTRHVYHLFVVRHPDRDRLMQELSEQQIYCGIHYPHPLNAADPLKSARTVPDGLPVCTRAASEILSLPIYPELRDEQVTRIAGALRAHLVADDPLEHSAASMRS